MLISEVATDIEIQFKVVVRFKEHTVGMLKTDELEVDIVFHIVWGLIGMILDFYKECGSLFTFFGRFIYESTLHKVVHLIWLLPALDKLKVKR